MNKYKTLVSNTMLISFGTFGSKLLVFLMVRFYTGYLTPADYGTADLLTQTANLLFPLVSLGITNAVFRFALDSEYDRRDVFSTGLYTITLGGLMFAVFVPVLNLFEGFKGYVWLIVVYTMASAYHSLCSNYLRAIGKTAFFALQGIINTSLVIVLNILFLAVFNMGILGYVLSVALADSVTTLIIVIKEKLWKILVLKPNSKAIKMMLRYAIPMIPATIFWWITSVSDRYMVTAFINSKANGIYSVAYKLPTFLTLLSTVFMEAWQFSAISESEGKREEHIEFFSKVWSSFQSLMFIAAAFVIAFSKPLIKILAANSYYQAWKYVPLLAASMVFSSFSSFMGSVYIVEKKSKNSFLTSMMGAVLNIILNALLIPIIGIQGAAVATFASYLLVFIIRCINARGYIPFNANIKLVFANTAIILLQTFFMVCAFKGFVIVQAVAVLVLLLINFKHIVVFLKKILSFVSKKGA